MTPPSKNVHLDSEAITRFRHKEKQALALPESILEEYRLSRLNPPVHRAVRRSESDIREQSAGAPATRYANASGNVFSWGHVLERRINQFILWDFALTHLLTRYHRRGLRLHDLQDVVFGTLEAELDCTSREPVTAVGLVGGWVIQPGGALNAFTVVVHFASEDAARRWTAETLIASILPKAIAKAREFVDRHED